MFILQVRLLWLREVKIIAPNQRADCTQDTWLQFSIPSVAPGLLYLPLILHDIYFWQHLPFIHLVRLLVSSQQALGSWTPTLQQTSSLVSNQERSREVSGLVPSADIPSPSLRRCLSSWSLAKYEGDFWQTVRVPEALGVWSHARREMEFPWFNRMKWTRVGPILSPGTNKYVGCMKWSHRPSGHLGLTNSRTGLCFIWTRRGQVYHFLRGEMQLRSNPEEDGMKTVTDSLDSVEIYPRILSELDLNFASCLHIVEYLNVIKYA